MPKRLTREQLHQLVWERPITSLASEFGLSDVALRKICVKHDVPTPPVGFWMKKEHGKPVTVTPLPKSAGDDADIIIREGPVANETQPMTNARQAVREALSEPGKNAGSNLIVEHTIAALEKVGPGRDGLIKSEKSGLIAVAVQLSSLHRASAVLRTLVACAEQAGLTLVANGGPAVWNCDGEIVTFELEEVADQVEHVATEQELAAVAKWQKERDERHRRTGYLETWGEPKIPKWERRYQGRLAIRLEEVRVKSEGNRWGASIQRTFADSRTRTVTSTIPRVVATIAALAAAKCGNREFEERQRVAEAETARRRAEAEQRKVMEQRSLAIVGQLLDEQDQVERLRRMIARLNQGKRLAERSARLSDWAKTRLAMLEARLDPEALEDRLAAAQLFGDDDA